MSAYPRNVVIATALDDAEHTVTRTGAALARRTGAAPWLIHAFSAYPPLTFPAGGGLDASWLEQQAKALGASLADEVEAAGLDAIPNFETSQARLQSGSPHREILSLAHRVKADWIVVGSAEGLLAGLGSTAARVVHKATCPVLVVRRGVPFPPRHALFAVDLSPVSAQALRRGLALLRELETPAGESAALFVLHPYEVGGSTAFTYDQVERFALEELGRFVTASAVPEAEPGHRKIRTGFARKEIVKAIEEEGADLVVLGTHGRGGFEKFVIGSVAEGVLQDAPCNVLVVPPPERASRGEAGLA
jgi:nucleotide-binding universal stress UspA family protein